MADLKKRIEGRTAHFNAYKDEAYTDQQAIIALLTSDLVGRITVAAINLEHLIPKLINHLQINPRQATQKEYELMADLMSHLDSHIKQHGCIKESPFIGDLREDARLWIVSAITNSFKDRDSL